MTLVTANHSAGAAVRPGAPQRHDARADGAAGGLLHPAEHGQEDEDALPGAAARWTGVQMYRAHLDPGPP